MAFYSNYLSIQNLNFKVYEVLFKNFCFRNFVSTLFGQIDSNENMMCVITYFKTRSKIKVIFLAKI